jgi:hypothetical protein
MREFRCPSAALAIACALLAAGAARARDLRAGLPPIVFVSRAPAAGADSGQVPGLGPHGTFVTGRGVLFECAPDGRMRALVPRERMLDVADPDVSPDGRRVAFSGVAAPGARWRIWVVEPASGDLHCLTCDTSDADTLADDADPCWWGDSLVFASTRAGGRALYDGTPATQLWLRTLPDGALTQLTHEPNGALDPVRDPRTRRLLFARWWFNPWVSASTLGLTREHARALTPDSVNVWQVVSATIVRDALHRPALADLRLAAGGVVPRRHGMGVQPAVLAGGGVLAVSARNTGLAPRPGALALQRYGTPPSAGVRMAGAAIGDDTGDPYTENANLAAPAACAPAALSDGRVLYALDPSGRGDFGLWVLSADGTSRTPLLDSLGTLELDPAVVQVQHVAHTHSHRDRSKLYVPIRYDSSPPFTYLDGDVFAGAGAPARRADAHLHVYRLVSADSVEQLQDVPVPQNGRVELHLPADTPLFEQLTDANGRALLSAHGPAQVRGFNSGAPGTTSRCKGCHLGHSTLH